MKLKLFFKPERLRKLKALGRVASYETVQPKGSAVNNSNTAAGFAGILDRIANSSLVGKIPFGDAAVRTAARNWSASIGVDKAMNPNAAVALPPEKPESAILEKLIGPGLLLAAPRADGSNDKKRR
jgi:hypothetical protein